MEEDALTASVAGIAEQVNKLISVRPIKNRYNGEIGDVVVGRITEVQQKRWKVDTNSRLDSVLLLSSVNLPGGELVNNTWLAVPQYVLCSSFLWINLVLLIFIFSAKKRHRG
jgi:exosome complex RNA-binding protein Rrp4